MTFFLRKARGFFFKLKSGSAIERAICEKHFKNELNVKDKNFIF